MTAAESFSHNQHVRLHTSPSATFSTLELELLGLILQQRRWVVDLDRDKKSRK
jgi:hypothetical protein